MKRLLAVFTVILWLAASLHAPVLYAASATASGTVPAGITAIVSDGTYNYLGTSSGKIYSQTISSGAISSTLVGSVPDAITGLSLSGTTIWATTSSGKTYYFSSGSTIPAWPRGGSVLDNAAAPTAAQSYGALNLMTSAGTVLLPTAVAGMSICVLDSGSAHDIIVDVQATDNVVFSGTELAGGTGITNASGSSTGDFVCLYAIVANKWYTMEKQGTWASQ